MEQTRHKNKETAFLHVRMPKNDAEFVKRWAQMNDISINKAMIKLIQDARKRLTIDANIVT